MNTLFSKRNVEITNEGVRFVLAGIVNTLFSYLLYLGLILIFPYLVAYTLAYILGISFAYSVNTWWVFGQPWSWVKLCQFPIVYLIQYLVNIILLHGLIEKLEMNKQLAPLIVIVLTLPITFLLSRWIIKRPKAISD